MFKANKVDRPVFWKIPQNPQKVIHVKFFTWAVLLGIFKIFGEFQTLNISLLR